MTEIPNRILTPQELRQLKQRKELDKATEGVEAEFVRRAETPSKWFGRLLAVLVIALFLDVTGWVSAYLSGRFYAALAFCLQATETLCVVGLAGLAIFGSIEAYRQQEAIKKVQAELRAKVQDP